MITKSFDLNDVFIISDIIDKMGLEADIEKITKTIKTSKVENKKDATTLGKEVAVGIGIDIVTKMIRNLHKAKNEVMQLIASLTGMSKDEVSKMGLRQIKDFFVDLTKQEGFKDFLSQAGELTEQK
jgi:hypothetical protein